MKYTLTNEFSLIKTNYGLIQNVSGEANIEITNDTKEQGILLKPFQTVEINTTVYARRISGGGTCALVVLPFVDSEVSEDETSSGTTDDTNTADTGTTADNSYGDYHGHKPHGNPYDVFGNSFFNGKPKPNFPPPPPAPPAKPAFPPPPPAPFPKPDDDGGLTIRIPKEYIDKGQRKFVVELPTRVHRD